MQSALSDALGIPKDAITIDLDANTAAVELGGAELDLAAIEAAMEKTNKFTATLIN